MSISKVRNAVIHNWVTEEEFELITGEPLLKELVGEPIFFFIVFVIQMLISVVNYAAAYACRKNKQYLGYISNLLAGISWTMTGLYKLGEYFLAL